MLDLAPLDMPGALDRVQNSLMADPVGKLRPHPPVNVPVTATLGEAMRSMIEAEVGTVLVVDDDGQLRGILSERDLLMRLTVDAAVDYRALLVADFMTPDPETVTVTDTLARALHRMDVGGYRHLPVVDGYKPVGVISARDLIRHITRLCRE